MLSTTTEVVLLHGSEITGRTQGRQHHEKVAFAAAAALSLGMFASAGTAAADGLDVSPPAIIDQDGFQNYDASSYPATPTYPGALSYPGASTYPG
jgi:hypothetical protein